MAADGQVFLGGGLKPGSPTVAGLGPEPCELGNMGRTVLPAERPPPFAAPIPGGATPRAAFPDKRLERTASMTADFQTTASRMPPDSGQLTGCARSASSLRIGPRTAPVPPAVVRSWPHPASTMPSRVAVRLPNSPPDSGNGRPPDRSTG
jgi:hypothetical protein